MESITTAIRNKMALKYGLIVGVIYLVIFSGTNLLVGNYIVYMVMKAVGYILYMVLIGVFITQIKKANGGYMEFKEAFGAAFVVLLAANILYLVYAWVYFTYLDPQFMEKIKVSVVGFMEKMKAPDASIEDTIKKMDDGIAEGKTFNLGKSLLGFCGFLVMDSLFAMIVCLVVKKQRPVFQA